MYILSQSLERHHSVLDKKDYVGFPGGSVVKNLPAMQGDEGDPVLIPGSGRSPGGGNGNQLHYSCMENSMDRGTWQAAVHRVAESRTQLSTHHNKSFWLPQWLRW